MEGTISLFDILKTLKKRLILILLITLMAGVISFLVSIYLLKPVYQTSTQMLVNQKSTNNQVEITQLRSNIELINTYSMIIKSPAILEKVIDKLNLTKSVEELNQNITIDSQENSQVFTLIVENPDPLLAVEIANTVSETFREEIPHIMSVDNVSILARAEVKKNPSPVRPKPFINIAISVLVGLVVGIGISFVLEILDNTLKDEHDVALILELPVLGSIEKMSARVHKSSKGSRKQKIRGETIVRSAEK